MERKLLFGILLLFYFGCHSVVAQKLEPIPLPSTVFKKEIPTIEINSTTVSENVTLRKGRLSKAVSATEVAIYQTSNTPEDPKIAGINGSSNSAAPLVGDLIVFDPSTTNRNIRTIVVSLHHPPGVPRQPIDFTLAMYESCPSQSSGTQGFACGSGSNIIPGSSFTETFTPPSDGVYNMIYTYDTPVNAYNKGDEIAIMFKAVSVAPVNFVLNTPIVIGRQPAGEPSEGSIAWCGESLTYSGCRIAQEGLLHNNFSIIVFAEEDSYPPTANCKPYTLVLNNFGLGTLIPENINNGSFDTEGSAISLSINKSSFRCSDIGENTVTLTVTDEYGNKSSCTSIVTVESPGLSIAACSNKTFEVDENSCTKKYNFNTVTQGIVCSPITIEQTQGPPSGSQLPIGVTTFAFKATNEIGDEATCTYSVTVTPAPLEITCSPTISVEYVPSECGAVVNYIKPTTNSCEPDISNSLSTTFASTTKGGLNGAVYFDVSIGNANIALNALELNIDQNGSAFNVSVYTLEGGYAGNETNAALWGAPSAIGSGTAAGQGNPSLATLNNDIVLAANTTYGIALVLDENHQHVYGNTAQNYVNEELSITSGKASNKAFTGVVFSPRLWNGRLMYTIPKTTILQTAGLPSGSIFPLGTTTNTFVATDSKGASVTCSFDVTVSDTEAPEIICPEPIVVTLAPEQCKAVVDYDLTINKVCNTITANSITTLFPADNYFYTLGGDAMYFDVTVGEVDLQLNSLELNLSTSITDHTFSASVFTLEGGYSGNETNIGKWGNPLATGSGTVADVLNELSLATLNKSISLKANTTYGFAIVLDGNTRLIFALGAGSYSNEDLTINTGKIGIPFDGINPDPRTVNGRLIYTKKEFNIKQTSGLASGEEFPIGTTTNTFTVTDISGNSTTCSFDVTVDDVVASEITCPDPIIKEAGLNQCSAIVEYDMPIATERCGDLTASTIYFPTVQYPFSKVVYFDVTIGEKDLKLNALELNLSQDGGEPFLVSVYTVEGSYVENNKNAGIWGSPKALGTGITADFNKSSLAILDGEIILKANTTYGFALVLDENTEHRYTRVSGIFEYDDLSITTGAASENPFTGFIASQSTWNGSLIYTKDPIITQTAGLPSGSEFPIGTTKNTFKVTSASGTISTCSFEVTVNGSNSNTIYVNAAVDGGTGDGSSWENAFRDLQSALNFTTTCNAVGDIWVAAGTYHPTVDHTGSSTPTNGKEKVFFITKNLRIYGGFAGTETSLSERNWEINKTILSGDFNNDDTPKLSSSPPRIDNTTENAYHVIVNVNLTADAVFDGLTVKGGDANGSSGFLYQFNTISQENGGGMQNVNSSPTLRNITFEQNSAENGGGIYNGNGSTPEMNNLTFRDNVAFSGAGIYDDGNNPTIKNSTFENNKVSQNGGGIYGFSFEIINSIFLKNSSLGNGGGIYFTNANAKISNSTFVENTASADGGGIYSIRSTPIVTNTVFWNNAKNGDNNIAGADILATSNNVTATNCLTQVYNTGTDNIINKDPVFVDAANGDLRLQSCSPAINAGTPDTTGLNLGLVDLAGNPRVFEDRIDIGAFEYQRNSYKSTIFVDADATGNNDGSTWANAYTDLQDALDARMACSIVDTILIAEGTYYPTQSPDESTTNPRDRAFHLANANVVIQGGYKASTGTQTGGSTILSGDLVTAGTASDSANHVFITTGLSSATVISKLTITAAKANGDFNFIIYASKGFSRNRGGGMSNRSSSPILTNCVFEGNSALLSGGGMYNVSSSPTLTNCVFTSNSANNGGGVDNSSSSSPTLTNCLFKRNSADNNGGGMDNSSSSSATLTNCVFAGNSANFGGGMYNRSSSPTLTNTFFFKNTATTGKSILNSSSSSLKSNSTHNASDADLSVFPNTKIDLSGLFYKDLFVDSTDLDGADDVWMTADDGLRLIPKSILRDVGTATGAPSEDITGFTRPTPPSIGAYEYSPCSFAQAVIYVDVNASGNETGTSWANAFTDLQDALDARMACSIVDTILIAEGTYYPTQSPDGSTTNARDRAFHLANANVVILGGYDASTGTQAGSSTILSGDLVTAGTASDSAYHVFITTGLSSATVISTLTLTAAKANSSSSITYASNIFFRSQGGGMNNYSSSPTLTNCVFASNSADFGGGIYNSSSSPTIVNVTLASNTVSIRGGGMYNSSSSPSVTNSIFWNNMKATSTTADGADIENYNSSSPIVTYTSLQSYTGSTGCLIGDPLFVDAANWDYRLQACSPAINAGTPDTTSLNLGLVDLAGNPRVFDGRIEIGAFERQTEPFKVTASTVSAVICPGSTLNLSALAENGDEAATYAWTGPNGFTDNIQNPVVVNADSGMYVVTAVAGLCTVKDSIKITYPEELNITTNSSAFNDIYGCENALTVIGLDIENAASFTYQWQQSTGGAFTDLAESTPYSQVTNDTLEINPTSLSMDGYQYRALISNGCETVISDTFNLKVGATPMITLQPASQIVCPNNEAILEVDVNGSGVSFQWQIDNGSGFVNVSGTEYFGANSKKLIISNFDFAKSGKAFRCLVFTSCFQVPSDPATITINTDVTILAQPMSQTVCEFGTAIFTAQAVKLSAGALTYQWQRKAGTGNWIDVNTGGRYVVNGNQLSIANAPASWNGAEFRCLMNDYCQTIPKTLNVIPVAHVTQSPVNQEICVGNNANFSVTAAGEGLTYRWQVNSGSGFVNLTDGGFYQGVTSANLSLSFPTAAVNGYQYRCLVSGTSTCDLVADTSALASISIGVSAEAQTVFYNSPISTDDGVTQAVGYILGISDIIAPNGKAEYRAGNSILLNPGFEVEAGAVFKAKIQNPCQTVSTSFDGGSSKIPKEKVK